MCFPINKFEISTVVTKNFFSEVINLMYGKIVLNYSPVTGEIISNMIFTTKKLEKTKTVFHSLYTISFVLIIILKNLQKLLLKGKKEK